MSYTMLRFPNFLKKAVTLSYDDGSIYDKKMIEILNAYGLKGTFNLNSGLAEESNGWRLSIDELKNLFADDSHEVAVHGRKHIKLDEVCNTAILEELLEDRKKMETYFSRFIIGMAYPYGAYNDRVVEMVKACGIAYARTVISTGKFDVPNDWLRIAPTCHHNDSELFSLCDDFSADLESTKNLWNITPKVFYLWGHSHEFERDGNWERLEKFCKKIGQRKDIWYVTNKQLYLYVKAYEELIWSADGKSVYNPSNLDVFLETDKKFAVRSGEIKKLC